jgi:hypothetical protein
VNAPVTLVLACGHSIAATTTPRRKDGKLGSTVCPKCGRRRRIIQAHHWETRTER